MGSISQKIQEFEEKILSKFENSDAAKNMSPKTMSIIAFLILFVFMIGIFLLVNFVF